ncbi:MAG: Sua5/YciO/YrdC/YwlC family protein [Pseudonocardia sp.]|nr:Sua5/YciO/YrdC/YwlC family protein [Pseudonocardia sp.]
MAETHRPAVPGLDAACRALARGQAVIVPNPSPMTYGLVATSASAVNTVKGRPIDQAVAVSLHDQGEWRRVTPALDLPDELLPMIDALLRERLSLLVPVRGAARLPAWAQSAVQGGHVAMFSGWWAPLAPLWNRFPRLYGSSANRTGQPPAASAADAASMLGADLPMIDGDALRDPRRVHAASTVVRVTPDGTLSPHRRGAQDAASGLDFDAYVQRLASIEIDGGAGADADADADAEVHRNGGTGR